MSRGYEVREIVQSPLLDLQLQVHLSATLVSQYTYWLEGNSHALEGVLVRYSLGLGRCQQSVQKIIYYY